MRVGFFCVALLLAVVGQAHAGILNGGGPTGSLTIVIRDDNGAIDAALFGGTDYFNAGTPVSNYGIQEGTNTGTFGLNDTSGGEGLPVTVTGNTASGSFSGVSFSRNYSLSGLNVLRVATTFTNTASSSTTISYFDSFDPDQGNNLGASFGTFNDVFSLGGTQVAQASINFGAFQHTVIAGSVNPGVTVAAGNPFSIGSGSDLNAFFASPFDGNGLFQDSGMHIGIRRTLAAGASTTYTYDLAFGLNPLEAQNAFLNAQSVAAVPEPSSLAVFAVISCLSTIGYVRRRAR